MPKVLWVNPSGSPTYFCWRNMHRRCSNPRDASYSHYGGRGISVCQRWRSYDAFVSDLGIRPSGLTLDRIDGNKGYTAENCAWRSMRDNLNNRRNTLRIAGSPVSRVAEAIGVKADTLRARLQRYGCSDARALTPGRLNRPRIVGHGTRLKYERDGCRCNACRASNTARHRAFLEKHRAH